MVIRASNTEKQSVALATIVPITVPAALYVGLNLIMADPTPVWMLVLTFAATALAGWFWFQRGLILSIRINGAEVEIIHLLGREVIPLSFVQSICEIGILGQQDFALVTKNGNVVPLNLGGFWDRKGLYKTLEHRIQDHNTRAKQKIDFPA